MRVPREERKTAYPLEVRMRGDDVHQPLPQPMPTVRLEDIDIADVGKGRVIGDGSSLQGDATIAARHRSSADPNLG